MKKITLFLFVTLFGMPAFSQVEPEPSSEWSSNKEVYAKKYMVVTAHRLASEAAAELIEKGGSAVDAAIAAQMVLNVVEPQSSGIGGGGFMLHYDAKNNNLTSYDGRETAPLGAKPDMFIDEEGKPLGFFDAVRSGRAVGTPGLLAMLGMVHKKHGILPWGELFKLAIKIAKNGFPISPRLNVSVEYAASQNVSQAFKDLYLEKNGNVKSVGSNLKNPEFAVVLENIAEHGVTLFYEGEIVENIVKEVQSRGGYLTKRDFAGYKAKEREVVCSTYRGYKVCGMGMPSSGGVTTLQTLGILENFELTDAYSPRDIHLILEAQKLAYADRNHYLADSDIVKVPHVSKMLDTDYLKQRSSIIDDMNASKEPRIAGNFNASNGFDSTYDAPSTTHLSIVDKEGNAVSLTSSVEHSFGSAIVVDGFILNNQLTDFAFTPEQGGKPVANAVAPGKRPRSSMAPTIIFNKDGSLYAVLGSPGGSSIIAYVTKTIIGLIDWKMGLQEIINNPHFMHKNTKAVLEEGQSKSFEGLESIGHEVNFKKTTSGVNAILFNGGSRRLIGATDPRREGVAVGF